MRARLAERLRALGHEPSQAHALQGGDLSEVWALAEVVVKTGETVATEGRMLAALGAAGAPVPAVHHVEPGLLILERLQPDRPTPAHWQAFGTALAQLHAHPADSYGWEEDHAFGPVALVNAPLPAQPGLWPAFWAERRLLPLAGTLPADRARRVERLAATLPDRLPADPGGLIHGDLWQGNLVFTAGRAMLIDPAVIRGHGEVDLGMLTLFGQPPEAFVQGYGPLAPGWRERRPVYQLHPALVHLALFGTAYAGLVDRLLDACGA
ncbi:fructosamine kinase family protein [Frigidibacter sp. MR17.24]|uniref:fructosamine kinase family protein n=1 Tax=Frigidibacter sp. MR17.24 TaxID=3127345 RepID=UPI003012A578